MTDNTIQQQACVLTGSRSDYGLASNLDSKLSYSTDTSQIEVVKDANDLSKWLWNLR
jgi:hypothetical protein